MITFVKQFPSDYPLVKESLEGPEPDREQIPQCVKARYNLLKFPSWESASIAENTSVKKDPHQIRCNSC